MMETEVVIVGGGVVGASAALAMAQAGQRAMLLENKAALAPTVSDALDHRIYALTAGSVALLEKLGVWQHMDQSRVTPVTQMSIWSDRGEYLEFRAHDLGQPFLTMMVENNRLLRALAEQLAIQTQIEVRTGVSPSSLEHERDSVLLRTQDQSALTCRLLVGADGADSWVRSTMDMDARHRDYGQMGVVANFRCEKPHGQVARQWFRADGVLAYLPIPQQRISIVWSTATAHAVHLQALPPEELAKEVAAAGNGELGHLELDSPVAAFPLRLTKVANLVAPHVALIGDAAHCVHPLAGQGVNLGLQDVSVLARTLGERKAPESCGDYLVLRRYERARREDIALMQGVTDGLHWLFQAKSPTIGALRNWGLGALNRRSWLKRQLAAHAIH